MLDDTNRLRPVRDQLARVPCRDITLVRAGEATTMALIDDRPSGHAAPRLLWLDLTRRCQLGCVHCYNDSRPDGGHGTMTRDDWVDVLDQAADYGVRRVQFIGGEPTLHPHAPDLVGHALGAGLAVEVFTNLVHVPACWWELFRRDGVSVATSYYSDDPGGHNAITGRPSHRLTRANIVRAVQAGVPLRAGIINSGDGRRVTEARRDLEAVGVTRITVDRVRGIGRAADRPASAPAAPSEMDELCGRCGDGRASVGPTGDVSPCVMSSWMSVGNVRHGSLAAIVGGKAMADAAASIAAASIAAAPHAGGCEPDQECSPGTPGSGCTPKAKA